MPHQLDAEASWARVNILVVLEVCCSLRKLGQLVSANDMQRPWSSRACLLCAAAACLAAWLPVRWGPEYLQLASLFAGQALLLVIAVVSRAAPPFLAAFHGRYFSLDVCQTQDLGGIQTIRFSSHWMHCQALLHHITLLIMHGHNQILHIIIGKYTGLPNLENRRECKKEACVRIAKCCCIVTFFAALRCLERYQYASQLF